MSINTKLLGNSLKRLGILLFLFILSPISLTIGFKALKRFTEAPKQYVAYLILTISFLLIIYTIYFAFKTFKIFLSAIFEES